MKGRKIFVGTDNMGHAAYFGWQDKGQALYGLREGYKNSADDLVSLVISSNCDSKTLDTYIFIPLKFLSSTFINDAMESCQKVGMIY